MTGTHLRFDPQLEHVNSAELKTMARIWGGRGNERRDVCIALIRAGLADPACVAAAVLALTPYEQAALALLKWAGGVLPAGALATGLRASGVALPKSRGWSSNSTSELIEPLLRRGLLLSNYTTNPAAIYELFGSGSEIFSDDRLLAQIGPLDYQPLALPPAAVPSSTSERRPSNVIMDIIAVLQAIDALGGLQTTKAGAVRAADTRKLSKALGWQPAHSTIDGLNFPEPAVALPAALGEIQLLQATNDRLLTSDWPTPFVQHSYVEQVRALLNGFIRASAWREWTAHEWFNAQDIRPVQGRMALCVVLAALPTDSRAFMAIDDLDHALFSRIGEHFSLSYIMHQPYTYNQTAEQLKQAQLAWHERLRDAWLKQERPWLHAAITTWLYYLGVVELSYAEDRPVSFRLTELGRAVLHPELAHELAVPAESRPGAWLVQPDFEVMVYLDHASAEQIGFLERHAERVQAQQHVARYQLTRAGIYKGLEAGTTLDDLLTRLRGGASIDLPQNVLATIRDWASQRERVTLRRAASLLEFPSAESRAAALAGGLSGTLVGERFVMLPAVYGLGSTIIGQQIDYELPPPACLAVTERGEVSFTKPVTDLLVQAQLARWAEPIDAQSWRFTAPSIAAAVARKLSIEELFVLLRERLTHPLPMLLGIALRAWAGDRPQAELANITVLRCTRPVVFSAIANSPLFKPYLHSTLAPDLLLVKTEQIEQLQAELSWAGLDVADVLSQGSGVGG